MAWRLLPMADVSHRSRLGSEHNTTWADCPERTIATFGRLMIEPVVQLGRGVDLQTSVAALIKVAENIEIFSRFSFLPSSSFFVGLRIRREWLGCKSSDLN